MIKFRNINVSKTLDDRHDNEQPNKLTWLQKVSYGAALCRNRFCEKAP